MPEGDAPLQPSAPPSLPAPRKVVPGVPTVDDALATFQAGADGTLDRSAVESILGHSRRGLRANAATVSAALMDKMLRGRKSPVDGKVAMFVAQGIGLTQKGAAITEEERKRIDQEEAEYAAKPADALLNQVLIGAGLRNPDPRGAS